jgi:hypothetical protein
MRITSAGNVAIGTTSATTNKLVVEGYGSANSIMTYPVAKFYGAGSGGLNIGTDGTNPQIATDNSGVDLTFLTRVAGVFYERMRITSGGNVGISTTSPNVKLEVYDTASSMTNNPGNSQIRASASSTQWLSLGYDASVNAGYIQAAQNGVAWRNIVLNRMGGNVSIGTDADNGSKLYVGGTIYAVGNITANSDLTLKKNLKLVENPIDKLNQLNGYLYQWKENDEYQYGVIAQEVEKILPHAVTTGTNGIKGVSYNQIIPVLIEAVKELNRKLEAK